MFPQELIGLCACWFMLFCHMCIRSLSYVWPHCGLLVCVSVKLKVIACVLCVCGFFVFMHYVLCLCVYLSCVPPNKVFVYETGSCGKHPPAFRTLWITLSRIGWNAPIWSPSTSSQLLLPYTKRFNFARFIITCHLKKVFGNSSKSTKRLRLKWCHQSLILKLEFSSIGYGMSTFHDPVLLHS